MNSQNNEIPQEWGITSFDQLCRQGALTIQNGFAEGGHNSTGNGIPHLRPFNVTDDGGIDLTQIKYVTPPATDSPYWVHKGDIIFNNTNSEELVGKTAFFRLEGDFVLSNHMTKLTVNPNQYVDAQWLAYLMHHCYQTGVMRSASRRYVNQAAVTLARLKAVNFALPPLTEQKAITRVLSIIQKAIETQDKIITAARELKRSLMHHLFTYGPVPVAEAENVPLKETEIGLVPGHWEVVKLGDLFSIKQGKALSPEHRKGVNPLPFLRTANVFWGKIDLTTLDKMDFLEQEVEALRLRPNDLLVCEGGDIGRTAIWDRQLDPVLYQNHLHRLRTDREDVHPHFYMYWMQAAHLQRVLYGGTGNKTTIPNLSQSRLKTFSLPKPSVSEQKEIALTLSMTDKRIEGEENHKSALQSLFKTTLYHLMTGKVRVKDTEVLHELTQ